MSAQDLEQRARELLAAEYERERCPNSAEAVRNNDAVQVDIDIAIRVIVAALRQQPAPATTEESSVVHPKLTSYIATRDRKIAGFWPHAPNHLRELFDELLTRGVVRVGGRSSCGGSDHTMTALRLWNEVVRKARTLGYDIKEVDCRSQRNAWATRGGGFWNESEYSLVDVPRGSA